MSNRPKPFVYTADEVAARTMDARGRIPHGHSSAGMSARVLAGRRIGVIVALGDRTGLCETYSKQADAPPDVRDDDLWLGVVWIPNGRKSLHDARAALKAFRRGELEVQVLPACGLLAVEAYLPPMAPHCTRDPYHWGDCHSTTHAHIGGRLVELSSTADEDNED